MSYSAPFHRRADGFVVVRLEEAELQVLRSLAADVRDLVESGDVDDPARVRLFPRAYLDPGEEVAETHWRVDAGAEVLADRLDRLATLVAAADAIEPTAGEVELLLDDEGQAVWLGVLNDTRLALGSRLDISGNDDIDRAGDDEARAAGFAIYDWLTYLQGELIEVLLG